MWRLLCDLTRLLTGIEGHCIFLCWNLAPTHRQRAEQGTLRQPSNLWACAGRSLHFGATQRSAVDCREHGLHQSLRGICWLRSTESQGRRLCPVSRLKSVDRRCLGRQPVCDARSFFFLLGPPRRWHPSTGKRGAPAGYNWLFRRRCGGGLSWCRWHRCGCSSCRGACRRWLPTRGVDAAWRCHSPRRHQTAWRHQEARRHHLGCAGSNGRQSGASASYFFFQGPSWWPRGIRPARLRWCLRGPSGLAKGRRCRGSQGRILGGYSVYVSLQ